MGNRHSKYKGAQAKWVEEETATDIYTFPSDSEPIHVEVFINDRPLFMEIDTGAAVSLLSQIKWQEFYPELVPRKTEVVLKTYTGERMDLVGEADVEVRYHEQ